MNSSSSVSFGGSHAARASRVDPRSDPRSDLHLDGLRREGRQRGLSLIGLLFFVVVIGLLAVVGLRVVPTFVEYRAIQSAIKKAHASANTIPGIQQAFDRSAAIDDITVMTGKDLDIAKVNDDLVISYAYTKKIPLFGPVSLVIDYAGNSSQL